MRLACAGANPLRVVVAHRRTPVQCAPRARRGHIISTAVRATIKVAHYRNTRGQRPFCTAANVEGSCLDRVNRVAFGRGGTGVHFRSPGKPTYSSLGAEAFWRTTCAASSTVADGALWFAKAAQAIEIHKGEEWAACKKGAVPRKEGVAPSRTPAVALNGTDMAQI
jgi:hypothetical protein